MTTLTNEQMLNNVMTIIRKMDISEEDDFKKEMNKVINKAMKDKTTVKKTKEPKDRMKAIAELWKEHKESTSE